MTVPNYRQSKNIKLSINKFIHTNFETPFYSNSVSYQMIAFDVSAKTKWMEINFLSEGAGRKSDTLVQFDCYTRAGGTSVDADIFRSDLDLMAQRLHAALHVDSIQVYDFAIPASPAVIPYAKLMIQNSDGTFREPEEDVNFDMVNGVVRRALTYRFLLLVDASQNLSYYD